MCAVLLPTVLLLRATSSGQPTKHNILFFFFLQNLAATQLSNEQLSLDSKVFVLAIVGTDLQKTAEVSLCMYRMTFVLSLDVDAI